MSIRITAYDAEFRNPVDDAATPFTFPGGEEHLRVNLPEDVLIDQALIWYAISRGASLQNLMQLGLMADVADGRDHWSVASLPYLPAARSDRGEPTGGYVYAHVIESFGLDRVVVLDPHSPTMPAWITGLVVADHIPLLVRATQGQKFDGVIAPDAGAVDRAARAADALGVEMFKATKTRDFETGEITGIHAPVLSAQGKYLVVDDICDGGGTFRGLAGALDLPRENLGLWVTHGIFSGKAPELKKDYGFIATTDSHPGSHNPNVASTIVPVSETMFAAARKDFLL